MSTMRKPRNIPNNGGCSIPAPNTLTTDQETVPHSVELFDASHLLPGMPAPKTILPQGIPEALRLPEQASSAVRSAIGILLEDELKLFAQGDNALRNDIGNAIALLALTVK